MAASDGWGDMTQSTIAVLMIEDVAEDAYIVRRLLRDVPDQDYTVQVARNEAEALRALEAPFDVCLMDLQLGSGSGFDLLQQVDLESLPGPVIVLTGADHSNIEADVYSAGVADFLSKAELSATALDRAIRYTRRQFDAAKQFRFLARHDELTGLLNRRSFHELLAERVADSASSGIAVFYIDLDGFKSINDSWGHDVGDEILRQAAGRLLSCFRRSDAVARYGGDEFVALMQPAPNDGVETVAHALIGAMRDPIVLHGESFTVTASIGVAIGREPSEEPSELIRKADHAMYRAKESGRDGYRIFRPDEAIKARDRGALATDLRQAVNDDTLRLVYQPVVNPATGAVCGAEALVRWDHPNLGAIPVDEILMVAEEVGLIRKLSDWVVQTAVCDLPTLRAEAHADFWLSINITPQQLTQTQFADMVLGALQAQGCRPEHLRLELTEHSLLGADAASLSAIEHLHDAGVGLLIDDFGAGHSSLSYLARLPVAGIKLAGQFIEQIPHHARSANLVAAVLGIGDALRIGVIVEGIESPEQAGFLVDQGRALAQGFHFSPGIPLDQFLAYAQAHGTAGSNV